MILTALLTAWACPPTADQILRARAAYDDAEPDIAAGILATADEELGCQTALVGRNTLLELYRLQALVALARARDTEAVEAIMRAVTIDPLATPPPDYGPEVIGLHRSWAGRLSDKTAVVNVLGGGRVFIDGQPLTHGQETTVVRGHHLVQIDGATGFTSVMDVLDRDRAVVTGLPSPEADPDSALQEPTSPVPPTRVRTRWRPAALWIAGGALTAAGAGLTVLAARQEQAFHDRRYVDYLEVDRDAVRIRALYIVGYSSLGVGGASLATVTIGLPRKRR
jgi:hypothetical protein